MTNKLTDERILRISEETALNYVTDERRPDNATIIEFAREIERELVSKADQSLLETVSVSDIKQAMRLAEKGRGSKWVNYDGSKLAAVLEDLIGDVSSSEDES